MNVGVSDCGGCGDACGFKGHSSCLRREYVLVFSPYLCLFSPTFSISSLIAVFINSLQVGCAVYYQDANLVNVVF